MIRIHNNGMQELQRFEDLPPFDELPLPFIPDRRQRPKPPLMYFGWKINADEWFNYAERHNLTVTVRVMHFEGEDDPDFSENDEDDTPETVVEETSKYHSVAHVFWSFLWELEITPYTVCPLKCCMSLRGSVTMLALRDNYKDNSSLTQDKLQQLQDKLGETGPPGWYPSNHFHWTYR
ncbi:hypothetical protein EW026_g7309 [Hermanssonia centrifuga]|uniref:Uncharacterized protein n=1 Tax=Hermanssonia centrifuga TaxID=98765 RepID=A0A4S4K888_9APHY|nr:hypothetical protein EW026_g7309 [Hermanssonia centrifuga]